MITVSTVRELRAECDAARAVGNRVGFVPTMGYFHAGHRSLMRRARHESNLVVVSLFVNPLQFAPTEDLAAYPRDLAGDAAAAEAEGVDVLFTPTVDEITYWQELDALAVEAERTGHGPITHGDPEQGEAHVVHIAHIGSARQNLAWARDLGVLEPMP